MTPTATPFITPTPVPSMTPLMIKDYAFEAIQTHSINIGIAVVCAILFIAGLAMLFSFLFDVVRA